MACSVSSKPFSTLRLFSLLSRKSLFQFMVIKEQHDEGVEEVGIVSKLRPSVIPTNPDINSLCRKIKIQTGVVSRLIKDHSFYVADSEKALSKLEDMKV